MRLILSRLQDRNKKGPIRSWPRIMWAEYAGTPISAGLGSSRFSSSTKSFRVLYAASDFQTALAEAVVRDRMVGKTRGYLHKPHVEARRVTEISSIVDLHLLDLTGGATYSLGIDTDTSRAKKHDKGQEFSEELHNQTAFDGILYSSRLTDGRCVAIYERAFPKLSGSDAVDLIAVPELYTELRRMNISIRRKRGLPP